MAIAFNVFSVLPAFSILRVKLGAMPFANCSRAASRFSLVALRGVSGYTPKPKVFLYLHNGTLA